MADVTLTQDTLWSAIKDIANTDGDTVDLNGYMLTIDESVVPQIKFSNSSRTYEGLFYIENNTQNFLTVNCYDSYYFNSLYGTSIRIRGQLISIGTVDSNLQLDVSTVLPADMPYPHAVYIPNDDVWLFNKRFYETNVAADEDYSMNSQKPIFSYDETTKIITFDFYPVPAGTDIQIENIILHKQNWTDAASTNLIYIGGTNNDAQEWSIYGCMFWGAYYWTQRLKNLEKTDYIREFKQCTIRNGTTSYQNYNRIYFEQCGFFEPTYSNGCLRLQESRNNHWHRCTFFPKWRNGNGTKNNKFTDFKLFGDGLDFDFWDYGSEFDTGKIVCAITRNTFRGQKYAKLRNLVIEGIANDAITWTHKLSMVSYVLEEVHFYNCTFKNAVYNILTSNYYGYNMITMRSCTLDSRGYPSNGNLLYPAQNSRIRLINCTVLNDTNSSSHWGRFSSGFNNSTDDWLIGYKGDYLGSLDSLWMLVLDFNPNANDDIKSITYTGSYFATHYNQTNAQWEIRCSFTYDPLPVRTIEVSGSVDSYSGIRMAKTGDYVIIDLTNGYNFMYMEIDTFLSGYYWEEAYSASNFIFEISLDEGKTWFPLNELAGKKAPKPFTMWLKATHTRDGDDRFKYLNIPFQRVSTFIKYPDYARFHNIKVVQLTHQEPMNIELFTELEGYMGRAVSQNGTAAIRYLYHETPETYEMRMRKYGYEFNVTSAQAEDKDELILYYTGLAKSDLTMTETEASQINGVTLQSSSDPDYTWELDCGGNTLEDTYHYTQYKLTNFGEWAGVDVFEFDEFLKRDGEAFRTVQARSGEGVKLVNYVGKVSGMTKDDGTVYVPPVSVLFTFTVTPSISDYEWRLYEVPQIGSLNSSVELTGEEHETSDTVTYGYTYNNVDKTVALQIIPQPNNDYVESVTYYTLGANDQTVTVQLEEDDNN